VRTNVATKPPAGDAQQALNAYGRIDILVNNAAIFSTIKMRPFWEIPLAEWDELMGVNVRGVWLAAKAVVPQYAQTAKRPHRQHLLGWCGWGGRTICITWRARVRWWR